MEQAVGDQYPLKSLMSGAQWREYAVISQAVAHVPPLGQKVVEDGVQAAAWLGRTVCRVTHGNHATCGSTNATNTSLYDSSGKIILRARC